MSNIKVGDKVRTGVYVCENCNAPIPATADFCIACEAGIDDAAFKAGIESMIAEAAAKVIGDGRAEMVDRIAKAIGAGLEPKFR